MDTEDIKRHKHNFKMLCQFLKQEKIYLPIKRQLFTNRKLSPNNFFEIIERETPFSWNIGGFRSKLTHRIDKRWAVIFNFVPYLGGYWGSGELRIFTSDEMERICNEWKEFLYQNNYDKKLVLL